MLACRSGFYKSTYRPDLIIGYGQDMINRIDHTVCFPVWNKT